jgi:hypothetical protein
LRTLHPQKGQSPADPKVQQVVVQLRELFASARVERTAAQFVPMRKRVDAEALLKRYGLETLMWHLAN